MNSKIRHGLSRDIPDPIKRAIRQHCKFGCVVCGGSIVQYEHVDPEFCDAISHDPARMTLLCPGCHGKVTSGMLSKETISRAMAHPHCITAGFASEIHFGGNILKNCPIPIAYGKLPLLQIKPAEMSGGPFRLSGNFFNASGRLSLSIYDNEWNVYVSNWDVEGAGGCITIRDAPGEISLKLVACPPKGIRVERIRMFFGLTKLECDDCCLVITRRDGSQSILSSCEAHNCSVGIQF